MNSRSILIASLAIMVLFSGVALAEENQSQNQSEDDSEQPVLISAQDQDSEDDFTTTVGAIRDKIRVSTQIRAEVRERLSNLTTKPGRIFSEAFSNDTNLVADPVIIGNRVVYLMDLPNGKQFYISKGRGTIFNLEDNVSAVFALKARKFIIDNEQEVDYQEIISKLKEQNVTMPIRVMVLSKLRARNLTIEPNEDGANLTDDDTQVKVRDDVKIENKTLYLIYNNASHKVIVLPHELRANIRSRLSNITNETLSEMILEVRNDKSVYVTKVARPFKLLWLIPMQTETDVVTDAENGNVIEINDQWYTILGSGKALGILKGANLTQ